MQRIDGSKLSTTFTLGLLAVLALPVLAQDQQAGPVPMRMRHFEGVVTVQRASAGETSEAIPNLPLDAGDRVWTESSGRAELTLADGTTVWLDQRTTLDIVALDDGRGGNSILRLWGGSVFIWRPALSSLSELRLDNGENVVLLRQPGLVRVDIDDERRLWLSVYDGQASLGAGGLVETLAAGEQSYTEPGTAPATASVFSTADVDDFGQWQRQRWSKYAATTQYVAQRDYIPDDVQPYAAELEASGSWFYYDDFGSYAWRPTVSVGWSPYRAGRWVWGYGGWTWASSVSWGWATAHYGRWHHLPAYGWVWFPGGGYRPASVSWYVGYGYVGWCPLGYYGRPFISIGLWFGGGYGYGYGYHGGHHYTYLNHGSGNGGRAVAGRGYARGGTATPAGWTLTDATDFGRGASVRRAVKRTDVPAGAAQNAATLNGTLRQRNVSALQVGSQGPSRSAGGPQRTVIVKGVATPRGGSRAGTAVRPGGSARPAGGGTAVRPGQTTPGKGPTGGRSVPPRVRPRPGSASVVRPAGAATVRPRPGGLAGGLSPTRSAISRPGSATRPSAVATRPSPNSGRPAVGRSPVVRPSNAAGRPTITRRAAPTRSGVGSRPGLSSRPQVAPRGTPGRSSIGRPSGGSRVAVPRSGASRGSIGRGAASRGAAGGSRRGTARRSGVRRRQ